MNTIKTATSLTEVCQGFEALKKINEDGTEYWSARDIQKQLGYSEWRKFNGVVNKAKTACEVSGHATVDHFVDADKMVDIGSSTAREIEDIHMTRYGCYLAAQNGDSRKPEIGLAQTYFAVRTRHDELSEQQFDDANRLIDRIGYREEHKQLSAAAVNSGVPNRNLGLFHSAGQRALQGGLSVNELKERKGLSADVNYPDYMGDIELTSNKLRMQLTTRRLSKGDINDQQTAIDTHAHYGKAVRRLLEEDSDLMPEDMPALESTRQVVERLKEI